jgi:hypothetical protein
MPADRKPSRAPKPSRRRPPPGARRAPGSRRARASEPQDVADDLPRPVVVGSTSLTADPPSPQTQTAGEAAPPPFTPDAPPAAAFDEPPQIERPRDEALLGLACAVLVASVFFPWYKLGTVRSVTGWASGTWGPVVLFLALAGLGVVALRRVRVAVVFPVDHSLVLEAIWWVSVAAIVVKRFFPPKIQFLGGLGSTWGFFVAMFAALAVALLGGRVSTGSPFVVRPGWFAGRAGKLGAGLLVVALAAGAAFGFTNSSEPKQGSAQQAPVVAPQTKQGKGLGPCAAQVRFPVPSGVTAKNWFAQTTGQTQFCAQILEAKLPVERVVSLYKVALRKAGWGFSQVANQYAKSSFSLTKPRCGTLSFGYDEKTAKSTGTAVFSACSPRATPSR